MPATIIYQTSTNTGTNNSSYTFSSQAIGTGASDRYVAVSVTSVFGSSQSSLSSGTIAGVGATIVRQTTGSTVAGLGTVAAIMIAAVPSTATTASITITFSTHATCERVGIGVWALYGIDPVVYATAASGVGVNPNDISMQTALGSVGVGAGYSNTVTTASWVGATENFDFGGAEGETYTGGSFLAISSAALRTVTITWGSATANAAVGAVWQAQSNFIDEATTRAPTPYGVIPPEMIGY